MTRVANAALRGDVRFQALPVPFQMLVAGLDAPIFEETAERRELLLDPPGGGGQERGFGGFLPAGGATR